MGKDYGMDVGVEGEIVWFATVSLNRQIHYFFPQIYYFRSIVCSLSGSWVVKALEERSPLAVFIAFVRRNRLNCMSRS